MQTSELAEQLRQIKRSLHGMMNGVAGSSMREKGLGYKVIFGVELPRLQAFAAELPHSSVLAGALWKENIRECRLLAGMLMPVEEMDAALAEVWVEQMQYQEEAECTVMHLFAHADWAGGKVFEWIASERNMFRLCGYLLLSRLFMQGALLNERDEAEYLDHAAAALHDTHAAVRSAAGKSLVKYMSLGAEQERQVEKLLSE